MPPNILHARNNNVAAYSESLALSVVAVFIDLWVFEGRHSAAAAITIHQKGNNKEGKEPRGTKEEGSKEGNDPKRS